jgi:hypothetical protein
MAQVTYPTIQETVAAYIAAGHKHGFAIAECILSKFTPKMLEGKCHNVPIDQRKKFIKELEEWGAER